MTTEAYLTIVILAIIVVLWFVSREPRFVTCDVCDGGGKLDGRICPKCDGYCGWMKGDK